ncbi:MAG: hypothetical protein EG824_05480 [Deltaproteobacteria bacterium]|nr:hypothetical protein [Deltaproteobacteria bacterium]
MCSKYNTIVGTFQSVSVSDTGSGNSVVFMEFAGWKVSSAGRLFRIADLVAWGGDRFRLEAGGRSIFSVVLGGEGMCVREKEKGPLDEKPLFYSSWSG